MPRPRRFRRVFAEPGATFFKPAGIPMRMLGEVVLSVEEVETLRLVDAEGRGQIEAAKVMNISQPTLNRLLSSARRKVAEGLTKGKAIRIRGGHYRIGRFL